MEEEAIALGVGLAGGGVCVVVIAVLRGRNSVAIVVGRATVGSVGSVLSTAVFGTVGSVATFGCVFAAAGGAEQREGDQGGRGEEGVCRGGRHGRFLGGLGARPTAMDAGVGKRVEGLW